MRDYNLILIGCGLGILTAIFTTVFTYQPSNSIQSTKPITPEKRLTTDGKTIDTLYIYKIK